MAAAEQEGYVFGGSPWKDEEGPSLYSALNVPSSASGEDVRRAYRRLCVTFHPDKHNNARDKDQARSLFENIKQAYDVLSNPERRFVYDTLGWRGLKAESSVDFPEGLCRTALEVEELKARFDRQLCEERNRMQCGSSCSVSMFVDARGVFSHTDSAKRRFSGLSMKKLVLNEAFDVALSPRDNFRCQVSMETTPDGDTHSALVSVYVHKFKAGPVLLTEVALSRIPHVNAELTTPLPAECSLVVQGRVHALTDLSRGLVSFFPCASAAIKRRVGPCGLQLRYSLEDELAEKPERISASVSCGTTRGSLEMQAEGLAVLKFTHPVNLAPSLVLEPKLSISLSGCRVSYALNYAWSSCTSTSVGVSIRYPGSVFCFLKILHQNQELSLPIAIDDSVSPSSLFYAHFVPLVVVGALRYCVAKPLMYLVSREQHKEEERRQRAEVATKRNEAAMFVRLMRATYDNSVAAEQARKGLVVLDAWYGALVSHRRPGSSPDDSSSQPQVADVKVATQCLVKDSKLILSAESKASLPGFFDPVPSQHKSFRVRYEFRGLLHEVTVDDTEPLQAPKRAHLIR